MSPFSFISAANFKVVAVFSSYASKIFKQNSELLVERLSWSDKIRMSLEYYNNFMLKSLCHIHNNVYDCLRREH